jgi:predicted nucleic acid-binding protein
MERVILDTNILIEILKGNEKVIDKLESLNFKYAISSITAI